MNCIEEKDVKVVAACCPECGNPTLVAVKHSMDKSDYREFAKLMADGFDIKTFPLLEYRELNLGLYCKPECTFKK